MIKIDCNVSPYQKARSSDFIFPRQFVVIFFFSSPRRPCSIIYPMAEIEPKKTAASAKISRRTRAHNRERRRHTARDQRCTRGILEGTSERTLSGGSPVTRVGDDGQQRQRRRRQRAGTKADDIKGAHPRAAPAKIGARPIPVLIEGQLKLPEIECTSRGR